MKITLSKKQWELIGGKTGWAKEAQLGSAAEEAKKDLIGQEENTSQATQEEAKQEIQSAIQHGRRLILLYGNESVAQSLSREVAEEMKMTYRNANLGIMLTPDAIYGQSRDKAQRILDKIGAMSNTVVYIGEAGDIPGMKPRTNRSLGSTAEEMRKDIEMTFKIFVDSLRTQKSVALIGFVNNPSEIDLAIMNRAIFIEI